jgi:23S rRNA pseudouridine1911/1915/1917 synthase
MKRSSQNPDARGKRGAKRPPQPIVSREEAGRFLVDWLRQRLSLPRDSALLLVRRGLVRVGGKPCVDPQQRVQRGQRIDIRPPKKDAKNKAQTPRRTALLSRPEAETAQESRPTGKAPVIRFADEHVVVVEKPPGMTTMRHAEEANEFGPRGKRFLPPTLADILPSLLAKGRPGRQPPVRAVHRIDNETSGLVVFARTVEAERHLGQQFRAHSTDRVYLALVRGRAQSGRIESHLVRDRGDGRRGSATNDGAGQRAVTHVRVVEKLGDYTLVECRLETGRTHQVRIHLGEAGTPLCGERIYDRPLHGKPLPDNSGAKRIMLHAASLGFEHPATGERREWQAELPEDMANLLKQLRRQ